MLPRAPEICGGHIYRSEVFTWIVLQFEVEQDPLRGKAYFIRYSASPSHAGNSSIADNFSACKGARNEKESQRWRLHLGSSAVQILLRYLNTLPPRKYANDLEDIPTLIWSRSPKRRKQTMQLPTPTPASPSQNNPSQKQGAHLLHRGYSFGRPLGAKASRMTKKPAASTRMNATVHQHQKDRRERWKTNKGQAATARNVRGGGGWG